MKEAILLARLLEYPTEDGLLSHLEEARELLALSEFPAGIRDGLRQFLDWMDSTDALTVQETYVEMVDRNRRGSLHLFEHIHGESRERGAAMIDLQEFYAQRGMAQSSNELPDWLPTILEFASASPTGPAKQFLSELAPVTECVFAEHARSGSLWAPVLEAVVFLCGGSREAAQKTKPSTQEPHLDELWVEPAVEFAGTCSTAGAAP